MKSFSKLIAGAMIALSALAFTPAVYAQTAPAPTVTQAATPAKFDGYKLYKEAFEAWRDMHIKLDSPAAVEKWAKEWEHKFDKTGDLDTEEGADKALLKMAQSFGQRFDYSFDKKATSAEADQVRSTLFGIGATLSLTKQAEIVKSQAFQDIKQMPKDKQLAEIQKQLAISAENQLKIEEAIEGSPAEKAGLKSGDIILKVDGVDLVGKSQTDAIAKIKGDINTTVKLTILRDGKEQDVSVTRAEVKVPVVKFKSDKEIGITGVSYFRLNDFMSKNAVPEFHAALKKAAGGKAVIIDLRGNPGGALPYVLTMSGMLLEDGPLLITRSRVGDRIVESEITLNKNFVLRTEPSEQDPNQIEVSTGPRPKLVIPTDMPVIVLIDEGSASASEILSGALQHNKRAVVVGMPSHGKGVGQTVIQLSFGRSLHVTSFEFVPGRTPNDWTGVIPDHIVERGNDPKVDGQLEKAKELIVPMIKSAEEMKAKRDENRKKHEDEFKKELELRAKGGSNEEIE